MHPRTYLSMSPEDRATISAWSRRRLALYALVALGLTAYYGYNQRTNPGPQLASQDEQTLAPACQQWHQAASLVVARLVESTRDADLRQANDGVFRLRRARRNCEEGWVALACQDYQSVARSMPGRVGMHKDSRPDCTRSADTGSGATRY